MLKTAMIFGNHMTLQRQKPIQVWGTAEPDAEVKVTLENIGCEANTIASESGEWMAELPSCEAAVGLKMVISSGEETITYTDVRVGEVWIAGGQSNMEYFLMFDEQHETVLKDNREEITFFDYPEVSYEEQIEEKDYSRFGIWRTCDPENLPYYSAVGYYFAVQLQEKLQVPVGIVGCNWGGTPACTWMPKDALKGTKGECWIQEYEDGIKELNEELYQKAFRMNPENEHTEPFADNIQKQMQNKMFYPGLSREEQVKLLEMMAQYQQGQAMPGIPAVGPWSEKRPGGLYETMLTKVAPYTNRGVIFYQGETDETHADAYEEVLTQLILSWRKLWGEELPFLMVQLAPFEEWLACSGTRFPILRQAQEQVCKEMNQVYLCSSSDNGMQWDIHPKNKQPIGDRLALLAREHVYGETVLCDAPEAEKVQLEADGLSITFLNSTELHIEGQAVNALSVVDQNGEILPIESVQIEGNKMLLRGKFEKGNVIHFARTPYYEVNLYNEVGNPAKPFEVIIE